MTYSPNCIVDAILALMTLLILHRTAINLILAFAVALKHRLRFEPYAQYQDLAGLVNHIDTFAKEADDPTGGTPPKKTPWKVVGEYLGISFAESNPRKLLKRSKKPLGNMPLEIQTYLSAYFESKIVDGTLKLPSVQGQVCKLCLRSSCHAL